MTTHTQLQALIGR